MPKGPKITAEVKRLIAEVNDKHPDWVAKEVMEEVRARLRQVNHQVKPDWPGLSAVQIELRKLRQRKINDEPFGIDSPWSVGALGKYDIPSQAIPKVLEIQGLRLGHEPLTIREARWVGHLHAVTEDVVELAIWATFYAYREKMCEQANIVNDTSDIDLWVRSKDVTIPLYFQWLFRQDWVPDSYKKQLAEEQTRRCENALGIKAERPNLTTKGWLSYADSLQQTLFLDNTTKDQDKKWRQLKVLNSRLLAKHEGQVLSSPGKYIDLLEILRTGEYREKPFESTEKFLMFSKNGAVEFAEELLEFHDPDLAEFMRKSAVAGGPLSEAISKIASSTVNIKKHHIEGGKR